MKLHFGIPITNELLNNEWEDYEGEYSGKELSEVPLPFLKYVFTTPKLKVDDSMLVAIDKEIGKRHGKR